MPDYTDEQRARLADEIEAAPADAVWPDVIVDYAGVKARCEALEE